MDNQIKLGVSLYSYSFPYNFGLMSFEDCLRTAHEQGYEGIEIVAAQMVPEYPYPSDRWIDEFKDLLVKYELNLISWSAYIDIGLRSADRDLTEDEIIQFTRNDMIYAKKAGAQLVRTQPHIPSKVLKKMLPFCKELDMVLAVELHAPGHPRLPIWQEYLEIMAEPSTEGYIGVVPDFGIFQYAVPKVFSDPMLESGFDPDRLIKFIEQHRAGVPQDELLKSDNFTEGEKAAIGQMYLMLNPQKIDILELLIPSTPYIHGKFHYLTEECVDETIPYDKIIPEVARLGFNGYIASEYEGHDAESVEQLRRFIAMNKKLLSTIEQ